MHKQTALRTVAASMILSLAVAGGCQNNNAKMEPSAKEKATREWNAARAQVLTGLAYDQYKSGNFDKSKQTVAEALKMTPQSPTLHILAAKLAIEGGQLERAEQELKLARQYAPNDGEAYYLSGVVYQRWQKPETAYDFYRQAATKAPAELQYVMAQSEMLVAMDRMPEALQLLQGKVAYFEHSGTIRDAVGQMQMQAGKYGEAVAMFREASILSESEVPIRERLALALYADKQYRECADVLTRLTQNDPYAKRADLFTMLGDCQLHQSDARAARYVFQAATQLDANSARAWQGFGRAALGCGDVKRAEIALNRALSLDRNNADSHLLMGYVLLKQGRTDDALPAFRKAATIDSRDPVALCMVGYALEKLGRTSEAAQAYGQAMRIKPGDEMAQQLMAGIDLHD